MSILFFAEYMAKICMRWIGDMIVLSIIHARKYRWTIGFMIQSEIVTCIFQVIIQMAIIIFLRHLIGQ